MQYQWSYDSCSVDNLSLNVLGTTDQVQPFDTTIWAHCMLHESTAPPELCPENFKDICEDVLEDSGLTLSDITHTNCRDIYLELVQNIKTLVNDGLFRIPIAMQHL